MFESRVLPLFYCTISEIQEQVRSDTSVESASILFIFFYLPSSSLEWPIWTDQESKLHTDPASFTIFVIKYFEMDIFGLFKLETLRSFSCLSTEAIEVLPKNSNFRQEGFKNWEKKIHGK